MSPCHDDRASRQDGCSRSPPKSPVSSDSNLREEKTRRGEKTKGERKELPQYIPGNPWCSIQNGWCPENDGTDLPERAKVLTPESDSVNKIVIINDLLDRDGLPEEPSPPYSQLIHQGQEA